VVHTNDDVDAMLEAAADAFTAISHGPA
jgi:hypothetical protein